MKSPEDFNDTETLLISCVQTVLVTVSYEMEKASADGISPLEFRLSNEASHNIADICADILKRVMELTSEELFQIISLFTGTLHSFDQLARILPPSVVEDMRRKHPMFRNMSLEPDVPDAFKDALNGLDLDLGDDDEESEADDD